MRVVTFHELSKQPLPLWHNIKLELQDTATRRARYDETASLPVEGG